ncbi:hypothetical protein Z043_119683, partial [Scleropages formosus]
SLVQPPRPGGFSVLGGTGAQRLGCVRGHRPLEFLIAQLEKLQASRAGAAETPCLFDHSNVDAVFGILDPTGQGHITLVQYKEALSTLGITGFDEFPEGAAADQVSLETFRRAA